MDHKQADRLRAAVLLAATDDARSNDERIVWDQNQWAGVWGADVRAHQDEIIWDDEGTRAYVPVTCGTFGCIAGHIAMGEGDRLVLDRIDVRWLLEDGDERATTNIVRSKDGEEYRVSERAAQLLGVPPHETEFLFAASNDLEMVILRANDLLTEYGHDPIDADELRAQAQRALGVKA